MHFDAYKCSQVSISALTIIPQFHSNIVYSIVSNNNKKKMEDESEAQRKRTEQMTNFRDNRSRRQKSAWRRHWSGLVVQLWRRETASGTWRHNHTEVDTMKMKPTKPHTDFIQSNNFMVLCARALVSTLCTQYDKEEGERVRERRRAPTIDNAK